MPRSRPPSATGRGTDVAKVTVTPMPDNYRRIKKDQPGHPPIFDDLGGADPITQADRELARRLIADLDEESRAWWGAVSDG